MNLDVVTYRARIGLFGPGRGFKGRSNMNKYNPTTTGSDIHYRMLAVCVMILFVLWSGSCASNTNLDAATITTDVRIFPIDIWKSTTYEHNSCIWQHTSWSNDLVQNLNFIFLVHSKDTESNPGPRMDQEDKNDIINAISSHWWFPKGRNSKCPFRYRTNQSWCWIGKIYMCWCKITSW